MTKTPTALIAVCLLLTAAFAPAAELPPYRVGDEIHVVESGDSLYRIVRAEYPDLQKFWPQVMRDLVKENPEAFRSADPGSLRIDSVIHLLVYGEAKADAQSTPAAPAQPAATAEPVAPVEAPAALPAGSTPASRGRHELAFIGRVSEIEGDVLAIDINNRQRVLGFDGEVYRGDAIITERGATATLAMLDEGAILLREDTRLVLESYTYQPNGTGNHAVISLLKGAFRGITGLLGKANPEALRINTPVATIGIRGTDLGLRICATNECVLPDEARPFEPGVYSGVLDGSIAIETAAGSLPLARGEFGKATSPNALPAPAPEAAALVFTADELAGLQVQEPPLGFWRWLKHKVLGDPT